MKGHCIRSTSLIRHADLKITMSCVDDSNIGSSRVLLDDTDSSPLRQRICGSGELESVSMAIRMSNPVLPQRSAC